MRKLQKIICLLLLAALLFTGCEPAAVPPPTEPAPPEYTEPLQDGYNQVTFYWTYSGTYENCDMWIWWGDKAGQGYLFHECEYGAKVVVNVPEGIEEIGFIVRKD